MQTHSEHIYDMTRPQRLQSTCKEVDTHYALWNVARQHRVLGNNKCEDQDGDNEHL